MARSKKQKNLFVAAFTDSLTPLAIQVLVAAFAGSFLARVIFGG